MGLSNPLSKLISKSVEYSKYKILQIKCLPNPLISLELDSKI